MSPTRITSLFSVGALALASLVSPARAEETVKVGVLHSLSGTMAISETSLRDVLLFTFDEINAKGGVLGKKIEPVVVDGASNWPLFAEKAKQLLEQDKVAVTFGCWTSVSRKSVLPVYEKNNGLLFYPVQYEGEEESKNVAYTAEAVNQQATPAVDYLLAQGVKKFYLLGSDYVYPQTTNLVLLEYLLSKGVPIENIGGGFRKDASGKIISAGKYTPFGHTDYQQIVAEIKQFSAGGGAAVVSTLNGDTNVPFFKEYAASGLTAESCPVVSFSISEDEFRGLPADKLVGQLGCWTYFQSIKSPANKKFVADFQAWLGKSTVPGIVKDGRVWMEGAVFDNSPNPNWIPCGVPYRSLVPKVKECTNLLTPTCPSSSYVAYGAYRIEFTFMAAGQACANAASLAVDSNSPVQRINLGQLTEMLRAQGQVVSVPR